MTDDRRPPALELLRVPEYRNFIVARFFYVMAQSLVATVIGWRIYDITHNPLAIGIVGLSEFIPAFSLALYAGHVVDKSDKRALILRTTGFYFLCVIGLLALVFGPLVELLHLHWVQWLKYAIIFCTGIIRSFAGPATNAIIAQIVPKEKLPGAVTINTSAFLFATVTGHATAGFLIAHTTYLFTFTIVGVYVIIAWFCFYRLAPKQIMVSGEKKTWESIKEGLRFVFRTKELLSAIALDLFAVLFGGVRALIPVFARDILNVGPVGYAWLNAAEDIGSMAMILSLTLLRPLKRHQGRTLLYVVTGFGTCIIIFGLSKIYLLSFLALVASGMLDGVSVVIRGTIVQVKTPDDMRGRVSAVNSMFINSSNELGMFESGFMAKLLRVVPSVVFGGCMTIGVAITTWFRAPTLRKMEY
jgi:predicted MFS family arabinose efflux permease